MNTNAIPSEGGDGGGARRSPIVEQYAEIRARQREIGNAEPLAAVPNARPRSYAIRVRHAKRLYFVSWLLPPETVMLNPQPEAAMRFGTREAAAALIEHIPGLREKAGWDEAGVVDIHRPYRGVSLLRSRDELRIPASA